MMFIIFPLGFCALSGADRLDIGWKIFGFEAVDH